MNLFKNIRLSDALVGLVLMFAALAAIGLIDHLSGAAASGVAVAMALQSSYSARMPVAVAGMIADMTNCDVDSRICETSAHRSGGGNGLPRYLCPGCHARRLHRRQVLAVRHDGRHVPR